MAIRDAQLDALPQPGLLIGDRRITDCSGGEIEHIYPATGRPTVRVPLAGAAEIDAAVKTARAAFPVWRAMPANERRRVMSRFSELLVAQAGSLARLAVTENGAAISFAQRLAGMCADFFAYNAGWIDKIGGHVIETWPTPALDYTREEPYGVVALITPWNSPILQFGLIGAPALAAGNCLVVKPSSLTPFSTVRFGELLLEAGFPPGVVNVVPTASGGGEILCSHPGIDKIHLTGSTETGKHVMALAARNLTPVGLELGGKSASIVFNDADLQPAVEEAAAWLALGAGQSCSKGSRFLVQSGIYDQFVAMCEAVAAQLPVGDPTLETTAAGPVISETQCRNIVGFIDRAKGNGSGRLVAGGKRLGGDLAGGFFIAPTVFADVPSDAEIFQEEVFGPVITITRFETEDEALRLANDSRYGLAAYIRTNDLKRAHRFASALEAGSVFINGPAMPPSAPFGGMKNSGFGRVGGLEGIREFTRVKNVMSAL